MRIFATAVFALLSLIQIAQADILNIRDEGSKASALQSVMNAQSEQLGSIPDENKVNLIIVTGTDSYTFQKDEVEAYTERFTKDLPGQTIVKVITDYSDFRKSWDIGEGNYIQSVLVFLHGFNSEEYGPFMATGGTSTTAISVKNWFGFAGDTKFLPGAVINFSNCKLVKPEAELANQELANLAKELKGFTSGWIYANYTFGFAGTEWAKGRQSEREARHLGQVIVHRSMFASEWLVTSIGSRINNRGYLFGVSKDTNESILMNARYFDVLKRKIRGSDNSVKN